MQQCANPRGPGCAVGRMRRRSETMSCTTERQRARRPTAGRPRSTALPLSCESTACVTKTLPLSCISTACVTKTLHLPCVSHCLHD